MSLMPTARDKLRSAELAANSSDALASAIAEHAKILEADNFALKARVLELEGRINTPHTDDWFEAVRFEAAHQIERFGATDGDKGPPAWFWLLSYLAGKVLHAWKEGDHEKMKHHIVSSAACLLNQFRHMDGEAPAPSMRPGIADPEAPRG